MLQGKDVYLRDHQEGDHSRCFVDQILHAEAWLDKYLYVS